MRELVKDILKTREKDGGINSVVWIAAGGSYGGFYPAQYFMDILDHAEGHDPK